MKVVERAKVLSVDGSRARVSIQLDDDPGKCASCAMASQCHRSAREFSVEAAPGIMAGDEVEVEIDLPSPAWAAFVLFIIPLAGLLAIGGLTYWLTGSGEYGIVGGIVGAAAVYLGLYFAKVGSGSGVRILHKVLS